MNQARATPWLYESRRHYGARWLSRTLGVNREKEMLYTFNVNFGSGAQAINNDYLRQYADMLDLDRFAKDRYSWLFVLNVLLYERIHGIDPSHIIDEIKALEGAGHKPETKPSTMFAREPLKGLWHQHFFAAHFVPHNISNHLAGDRLKKLVEEVMDPAKSAVVTQEMINELSHRLVHESMEQRAADKKLTGEWIIFAKHNGQNYYLCLATHETGDQIIFNNIKTGDCLQQFPELASQFA